MKRLFTGLIGLALAISVFGALAERGGLEAATPLPSGCYTDASGLPVCGPNYPGPGGTPGPQSSVGAGTCIGVSTPPAPGTVSYICPTPYPTPSSAAAPSASPPIDFTAGSPGFYSINLGPCFSVLAGVLQVNTSAASCSTQGGTSAYDTAVLAIADHYWRFADPVTGSTPGPCTNGTMADSTVNTTPAPLPTASTGAIVCGAQGVIKDGTSGIELDNGNVTGATGASFIEVPAAVTAGLCPTGTPATCTNAFTIGCTFIPNILYATFSVSVSSQNIFNIDSDGGHFGLIITTNASGGQQLSTVGFNAAGMNEPIAVAASGVSYQVVYTFDGTTTSKFYVNGVFAAQTSTKPSQNGSTGAFGALDATSGLDAYNGRIEKCWDNQTVAETPQVIRALYLASGLP
jgi:hypothetical protein